MARKPDFEQLLQVLRREKPDRPTPFELLIGNHVLEYATGEKAPGGGDAYALFVMRGFFAAGYDYATVRSSGFLFPSAEQGAGETISLNCGMISDEASFERFVWPDPADYSTARLDEMARQMPKGGKLAVMGPGGVLENVMSLVGYDDLCYLLYDEPELLERVFHEVGRRILTYYEMAVEHPAVGMLIANDDWGFNTQTFLKPGDMARYVFPWHKKFVELAHGSGKPIVLHSCGKFSDMIDPVAFELHYDGKHSYEDNILPVEESYRLWHEKIALLGGIDVDFLARSDEETIRKRCGAMLELAGAYGGYALGTGNSVPEYVPLKSWKAMMSVL